MVKGNWERRIEMASKKREIAKERKSTRKMGRYVVANAEAVIKALQPITSTTDVCVYLATDFTVCSSYLRNECTKKICRRPHKGDTLFNVLDVPSLPSASSSSSATSASVSSKSKGKGKDKEGVENCEATENGVILLKGIHEVTPQQYSRVLFISVDNVCVYDYANGEIWSKFAVQLTQLSNARDCSRMSTVKEGAWESEVEEGPIYYRADDEMTDVEGSKRDRDNDRLTRRLSNAMSEVSLKRVDSISGSETFTNPITKSISDSSNYRCQSHGVDVSTYLYDASFPLSFLLSCLDGTSLLNLLICSTKMKSIIQSDGYYRERRKIGQHQLISDRKKAKKKNKKAAHMGSNTKKDGFARGQS